MQRESVCVWKVRERVRMCARVAAGLWIARCDLISINLAKHCSLTDTAKSNSNNKLISRLAFYYYYFLRLLQYLTRRLLHCSASYRAGPCGCPVVRQLTKASSVRRALLTSLNGESFIVSLSHPWDK